MDAQDNYEYHKLLKFLYFEGYADSYEEAEELLESITDDEFENLLERKYDKDEKLPGSGKTPSEKMDTKRKQHRGRGTSSDPALGRSARHDPQRNSYFDRASTIDTVKDAQDAGEEPRDSSAFKNTIAARRRPRASYEVPNERPGGLRAKNTQAGGYRTFTRKEEFESVIEYLFVEGFADSYEEAEVIMVNMSEEWREDIVEEITPERRARYKRGLAIRQSDQEVVGKGKSRKRATSPQPGAQHYRKGMTQSHRDTMRDDEREENPERPEGSGSLPKGKKLERQRKTGVSAD
jgi:hypothetical protein